MVREFHRVKKWRSLSGLHIGNWTETLGSFISCMADIFRTVQWHNLAFCLWTTRDMVTTDFWLHVGNQPSGCFTGSDPHCLQEFVQMWMFFTQSLWSERSSRLHRGITDSFFQTLHWFSDTWHDVTLHYLTPTCMAPAHTTPFWCHFVSFYRLRWTTFSCKCFGSFPGSIGASVAASQRVVTGLQQSYSWMAWRKHWWDGWKISGGHIVAVVRLWMFVMNALCSLCLRSLRFKYPLYR